MIKVYYTDVSKLKFNEKELRNKVSKIRYQKIISFSKKQNKLLSLGVELLLNNAIKENFPEAVTPVNYIYDKMGKPYVKEIPLHFSLSHSWNYSVCAISENEIGIDIELVRDINLNIAKRFFTQKEYAYVISEPHKSIERFFDIWVLKESYIKATGYGLSLGLNKFTFFVSDGGEINVLENGEKKDFNFFRFLIDDRYKLAICSKYIKKSDEIKLNKVMF